MRKAGILIWLAAAVAAEESGWSQFQRARALEEAGETGRAEALYRACVQNSPKVKDAYYYLGVLLERKGDAKSAAELYEQVTDEYPTYAFAQSRLGQIALEGKDAKRAAECFERAAASAPTLDSCLQLASIRMDLREFEKAEAALGKAESFCPKDLRLAEAWGRLYMESKRHDLALKRFDAIVAEFPADARIHFLRAICLEKLDKKPLAVAALEAGLKVDPADPLILKRLIALYGDDPSRSADREMLRKRLEWIQQHPPKARPMPKAEIPSSPPVAAAK